MVKKLSDRTGAHIPVCDPCLPCLSIVCVWPVGPTALILPVKLVSDCRRNYYDATDALIFVVDSFDRKRLNEAGQEFAHILVWLQPA